jgi:hypothetical protein
MGTNHHHRRRSHLNPMPPTQPDPELSPETMLRIRDEVRATIAEALHRHTMLARALRKTGRDITARHEERAAEDCRRLLHSLTTEEDDTTPQPTRLTD